MFRQTEFFFFVETSSSSATRTPLRSRDDKKLTSASSDKQKTTTVPGQDGMMDSKTATNDDVYEFKSVKVEVLKMALTIIATLPQF